MSAVILPITFTAGHYVIHNHAYICTLPSSTSSDSGSVCFGFKGSVSDVQRSSGSCLRELRLAGLPGGLKLLLENERTWPASCNCHEAREEQEALFPSHFISRSDEENAGTQARGTGGTVLSPTGSCFPGTAKEEG